MEPLQLNIVNKETFTISLELLLETSLQWHSGGRRCASVLLELWNSHHFRGDLQELITLEYELQAAIITVLNYLFQQGKQLDRFISEKRIIPVIETWGHELGTQSYFAKQAPASLQIP